MKKVLWLSVVCLLILGAVLAGCSQPAPSPTPTAKPTSTPTASPTASPAAKITLVATIDHPVNAGLSLPIQMFKDVVAKKTNGQLVIDIHFGGEIVKAGNQLQAASVGTVDMVGQDASAYHSGTIPAFSFDFVPYVQDINNFSAVDNAVRDVANRTILNPKNLTALWRNAFGGGMVFWTKKSVTKMEDLQGLKIRGGGGMFSQTVLNLGAKDVSITSAEVITALQQGVIDGAYWGGTSVKTYKAYEIIKYGVLPALLPGSNWAYMNLARFNSLPQNIQAVILETSKEVDQEFNVTQLKALTKDLWTFLSQNGVTFNYLSPDELARWKAAQNGIRDWWITTGKAGETGKAILAELDKAVAKYPYTGSFEKSVFDSLKK